jgi:hypothetical protein
MRLGGKKAPAWRPLAFAFALLVPGAAQAQSAECQQLRAALAAPASVDPAAAAGARRAQAELGRLTAQARSMGCDNQQFLFFGSAPPPQCGGLKARVAALQSQYDALSARSSGDSPQRRALKAHYDSVCGGATREKNFWETMFGNFGEQRPAPPPDEGVVPEQPDLEEGSHGIGGSQAICVRSCDGGFFPLSFSAHSAPTADLEQLCQALCPNTEVKLYTKNPRNEIGTALGADGTAYADLPNALKFTKSFDPSCTCKPPNQDWVTALAHADQVLGEMGGAKASDTTVTEQQSKAMAQPLPPKPGKAAGPGVTPPNFSPARNAASAQPPSEPRVIEGEGPDGAPRQVRVIGPQL